MASSLARLQDVSRADMLRKVVETILIKDGSDIVDPWASSELSSDARTYDVWPRDEAGLVRINEIETSVLTELLRLGRLRPRTITIRDYRIV